MVERTEIADLTEEEKCFAAGRWDGYVRSFNRNREAGHAKGCERNRKSLQRLMWEEAEEIRYTYPTT